MSKYCIKLSVILISLSILLVVFIDNSAVAEKTIQLQGKDVKYFSLTPGKLATITRAHKQKHAVFIYASWCPACRSYLPRMIDIEETKSGSVFFVSLDKDNGALRRYLGSLSKWSNHMPLVATFCSFASNIACQQQSPQEV